MQSTGADFPGGTVPKFFPFCTSFAHAISASVKSLQEMSREYHQRAENITGRISPSEENYSLLRVFSAGKHSHLNACMSQRPTNPTNIQKGNIQKGNIQAFPFLPPQHPGYALACSLLQQSRFTSAGTGVTLASLQSSLLACEGAADSSR